MDRYLITNVAQPFIIFTLESLGSPDKNQCKISTPKRSHHYIDKGDQQRITISNLVLIFKPQLCYNLAGNL